MAERSYDVVLFGATGFAGGLTAEYLARHKPAGLRWALAGRKQAKLDAVRDRLAAIDVTLADLVAADAPTSPIPPDRCATSPRARASSSARSGPTSSTASRWSPPAPRPAPTTSISPASPSSSTRRTSATTPARCRPVLGSCIPADSTRSRTTSARTSRCCSSPRTSRFRSRATSVHRR